MRIHSFILVLFCLCCVHCRPDVIIDFTPYGVQHAEIYALLEQAIEPTAQYEFSLAHPTDATMKLVAPNGSFVEILDADRTFKTKQGQAIACRSCAELNIKVKEALTNNQIIAQGLTLQSSALTVAQTSGAVWLDISCDGNQLEVRDDAKVRLVALSPAGTLSDMDLYTALLDTAQRQSDWLAQPGNSVYKYFSITTNEKGYDFFLTKTGWSAGFLPLSGSTHSICVDMPSKFNAENTFAYLVLTDYHSTVRMPFDQRTGQFCLEGVPQNIEAQCVIVSRVGDNWHTAYTDFNTSDAIIAPNVKQVTATDVLQLVKQVK